MLASVVILLAPFSGIIYFYQSACPSGATLRSFVVIANDTTGYNNSRDQPFYMNVQKDDCVLITFVNNSTNQSHGLAITHYLNGIVAEPKTSGSARFQATQNGQFRAYEQLISTIHPFTAQCGTLNVA